MLDIFTKPLKLKKLFKKKFLPLILFNGFCFLSLFWTDSIKYTLASNFELLQTSLTIILVFSYIENNKYE